MKKLFQLAIILGCSVAMIGCTGLGDDDDDNSACTTCTLADGQYSSSNVQISVDECDFAGIAATFGIAVQVNGDVDLTSGGVTITLERNGGNINTALVSTEDSNPAFDCIERDTANFDGVITADDTISFTFTNYWETTTGTDAECATANQIAFFPCETIETFDLTL